MIFTVLQDTLRHTGHADVVRELIDGRVGMGPTDASVSDDDEYLQMYRARIAGELDREAWMAYNEGRPGYDPSAWSDFRRRVDALSPKRDG
jgi:hypothetical protein